MRTSALLTLLGDCALGQLGAVAGVCRRCRLMRFGVECWADCRVDVFSSHWIRGITAGGPDTAKTFKHNPVCELTVGDPASYCGAVTTAMPVPLVGSDGMGLAVGK